MIRHLNKLLGQDFLSLSNESVIPSIPQPSEHSEQLGANLLHLNGVTRLIEVVLDNSGSMESKCGHSNRLGSAKVAFISLVEKLQQNPESTAVGLIGFSSEAKVLLPPTPVSSGLRKFSSASNTLSTQGTTKMNRGLELAHQQLELCSQIRDREIIMLTDGYPDLGASPRKAAGQIKAQGIQLSTVGVGNRRSDVDENLLRSIASLENGTPRYWFISDADEITKRFESFAMPLRKL